MTLAAIAAAEARRGWAGSTPRSDKSRWNFIKP